MPLYKWDKYTCTDGYKPEKGTTYYMFPYQARETLSNLNLYKEIKCDGSWIQLSGKSKKFDMNNYRHNVRDFISEGYIYFEYPWFNGELSKYRYFCLIEVLKDNQVTYTSITAREGIVAGEFIELVYSFNETEYPKDDEKDGFYYKDFERLNAVAIMDKNIVYSRAQFISRGGVQKITPQIKFGGQLHTL